MLSETIRVVSNGMVYAVAASVVAHRVFQYKEPSAFAFLGLLSFSTISLLLYSITNGQVFCLALIFAIRMMGYFLAGLCSSITIYRLSPWHPLASYPGPALARITKWWMAYRIAEGKRHVLLRHLHSQYGPWLRIGPNEISVNLPDAIRPVYGQMFRAPYYRGARTDADALITTLDRAEHASRLIAWNKAFASDSLRNFRTFAEARTGQLLDIFCNECSTPINISRWISLWAMDIMGDMSFSGGFETLAAGRDTEGWMEVVSAGLQFVAGRVPWVSDIIARLPLPGPAAAFQEFSSRRIVSTEARGGALKQDIFGIIQDEGSGGPILSPQEAAADASFMVAAGSDTVSQALTSFFRYIVEDCSLQNRLRAEINAAFDVGDDYDVIKLAKLPFLDACVQETLRILPPVGLGPPRYSGNGGAVLSRYIPAGTTVACPTYTLHRDGDDYPQALTELDPDAFRPERWLSGSTIFPHVPEAFVPFSYGLGVCIGKPVALHNIKLLAARILQNFELSFAKDFDSMKFDSSYKELNIWLHDPLMISMKKI